MYHSNTTTFRWCGAEASRADEVGQLPCPPEFVSLSLSNNHACIFLSQRCHDCSSGKGQIGNAEKGCSSITYNLVMKQAGEGAAALSGAKWNQAVSDASSAQVICEVQEEISIYIRNVED